MNQDHQPWVGGQDPDPKVASAPVDAAQARGSVADAVVLVADDGVIRWANGAALEMFGYEPEAFVGQNVDILVPLVVRGGHVGHRAAYVVDPVTRPLEAVELSAVRSDGSQFRAEISLSPLQQADGVLTVAVVRDLTEQHRRQAKAERLARLVLDGALDAYIATDSKSIVLEWNTTAETMFGWTRDEAVGRPLPELIVPEGQRAEAVDTWSRFGGDDSPGFIGQMSESIACRRDGTEFPVEMSITTIGAGDRVTFHAFQRDISERKASQARMAQAAAVLASSPDGIAALDGDRNIVVWNPAMEDGLRVPGWGDRRPSVPGRHPGGVEATDERSSRRRVSRADGVLRRAAAA